MTLPNFLIIGAAKSGTSSLFQYLAQHPQVFCCRNKEPSFFAFEGKTVCFQGPCDELFNRSVVTDYRAYEELFDGVTNETAIGEASVVYLHHPKAALRIKHYVPHVKLIAVLRNPIDRAISSYAYLRRDGYEPLEDFSAALRAEEERKNANWQHLWQYSSLSFYFEPLSRYVARFPRENIAVYTYDEFSENYPAVLKDIFRFLGVDDSFVPDTSQKYNASGIPKSRLLHRLLIQPSRIKSALKPFIPPELRMSLQMKVMNKNLQLRRIEVPMEIRRQLVELFRQDITETALLTGKDLSKWLHA